MRTIHQREAREIEKSDADVTFEPLKPAVPKVGSIPDLLSSTKSLLHWSQLEFLSLKTEGIPDEITMGVISFA